MPYLEPWETEALVLSIVGIEMQEGLRRTLLKNTAPFWASTWKENASSSFRKHIPLEWTYKSSFKGWRQETERQRVSEMFMKGDICEGIVWEEESSYYLRDI